MKRIHVLYNTEKNSDYAVHRDEEGIFSVHTYEYDPKTKTLKLTHDGHSHTLHNVRQVTELH